jgi:hypothetical protein
MQPRSNYLISQIHNSIVMNLTLLDNWIGLVGTGPMGLALLLCFQISLFLK